MKYINKLVIIMVLMFTTVCIKAQDDLDIKLSETEINKTLDAIIAARGLNFGEHYDPAIGVDYWTANITGAYVDIKPNNVVNLVIEDMYFVTQIDLALFDFTTTEHFSGIIDAEFTVEGNETDGFNIVLKSKSVNIASWGDLIGLPGFIANLFYSDEIVDYIPDINLSLTDITPNFFTEAFNLGTPPISSDNECVYLNFNTIGDRFINIANKLLIPNSIPVTDEGDVYHLENSSFVPYKSGFEFAWDLNSDHTVKPEDSGITYDGDNNNHYKYDKWQDDFTEPVVRNLTVDDDEWYNALFNKSYSVNFSANYEGSTGNFGNININDNNYTFPKSEYIFAAPDWEPVSVSSNFTYNNNNYVFLNWSDGNTSTTRNISPTSPLSLTANYKGTQLSDNSNAYVSSSQRKFVYDKGGFCLVSVYESMGKIWLEGSYDDGETWFLFNNGKPLNGNTIATNPSINDAEDNAVAIVYQEYKDIRINIVDLNLPDANPIKYNNIVCTMLDGFYNAKPVIESQKNNNDNSLLYLIVWKEEYVNGFSNPGLHYRCLEKSVSHTYNFINNRTKISNTDANSTNPTLAAKYNHTYLHLAWEQQLNTYESEIRYYKINRSSTNTLSFSYYYKPSLGNVFLINSNPTMTVVDNGGMYMTWVGSSHESEDPPFKQVIMRCRHDGNWWYSTFFKYGSAVNNVSINSAEYPNQYYYGLAWVENGNTNYYKASTISGIQTLNTTGNYVQLSNGLGSCNNMQAMTFKNTSIPYAFTVSEKFGTGLSKENSTQDFEGREGIVSYPTKDNEKVERYYFTFSDIEVDGKPIKFVELDETVMINDVNDLNKYLTTESFELASISELTYNASFGLSDGDKEGKLIDNGKKVKFGVELVDSESEKVLGVYNEVDFKNGTFLSKNKNACKIIPNLKENKKVKLRLVVEDQEKGQYLISSIMSKSNVLNKEGTFEIVNSENLVVTEYQLSQNYPNPFNPQTTINYQLPQDGLVTLKVYDALGKEVAELVNDYKGAGSYDVIFNGSNLASGIYFYKITAGEFMTTKKLMLMK